MRHDRRASSPAATFVTMLALGAVAGCAHAVPLAAPPPAAAAERAASPAPSPTGPAFDVRAVARPPGLNLSVRLAHPEESRKAIAALIGDAFPASRAVTARGLLQFAVGDALTDVVDLSQPVDVAAAMVGTTTGAVALSVAVTRIDQAKKDLAEDFRIEGEPGGVLVLAPLPSAGKAKLSAHCALRPAFGPAPYRLVCATDAAFLASAGPYLAQTVTRQEARADAHAVLDVSSIGASVAAQSEPIEGDGPSADGARVGRALVFEPLAELSTVTLDADASARACDATLSVDLKSADSPLLKIGVALAREPGPLPEVFWRLPSDADFAFVSRGVARSDYGRLRTMVSDGIRGIAGAYLAPAVQERFMRLFDETFFTGGPLVVAHGFDAEAARAAIGLATPTHEAAKAAEADALAPWVVVEVDEPSTRWTHVADELRALAKMDVATPHDRARTGTDGASKPRMRSGLIVSPVPAAADLPAGSLHFTYEERPLPGAAKRATTDESAPYPTTVQFFVVPDAGRTWIAIGRVERVLLARLHGILGRGAKVSTLADRPGMDLLRDGKGNLAGFVTVAAFAANDVTSAPVSGHDRFKARARLDLIHDLPEHGATPIPFLFGGDVDGSDPKRLSIRAQLSRAAISEWMSLTKH
jgi:hypothetical protein